MQTTTPTRALVLRPIAIVYTHILANIRLKDTWREQVDPVRPLSSIFLDLVLKRQVLLPQGPAGAVEDLAA
jgi:hypothetical protein